ncbi:conserved hypothetical secreted protein [Azoarcus olearius]|uniref:Conserved hypothetical secreted protein n=2 Tax=Azoarcus sp. (strain BH72) TaxID=418699 RepID=A1K1Y5_AZOSB|nr:conserved hypothetical secreted protein [Azoarcus olearius]
MFRMVHRVIHFLLMLAVLFHAVVAQGGWAAAGSSPKASHAALHWQGAAHHHRGVDGTHIHHDTSPESLKHVNFDCAVHAVALLSAGLADLPRLPDATLFVATVLEPPVPFLERLKRPPRSAA